MTIPTTQWSLFAIASMDGGEAGREAMEELCRSYRSPVLSFFRMNLSSPEDAEDLTQNLLIQMTQRRIWRRADPELGRFRNYLLAIARNALRNWLRANKKERARVESLDLLKDFESAEGDPPIPPGHEFDRKWAESVMAAAFRRVEKRAGIRPGEAGRFVVLRKFLPGPDAPPSYEEAANALHLPVGHVKTLVHRMREGFRKTLREEVAKTLASAEDLEEEMSYLGAVLNSESPGRETKKQDF